MRSRRRTTIGGEGAATPSEAPEPGADRPSLLVLNLYMVWPPDSGAKIVIHNRLVELSRHFRITFCCLNEQPGDADGARELGRFAEVIVARGVRRRRGRLARTRAVLRDPCALDFADKLDAWFASPEMRDLLARRFDVVELHSSCWYRRSLGRARGLRILVSHNRERDYYAQRARAAWALAGPAAGLRAALDAALVAVQERRAIAASSAVVSLAPLGERQRRRWFGDLPVLSNWGGIDLDFYRPGRDGTAAAGDRRDDGGGPVLVFVAALFVEGAVEAAARFASDALPRIARDFPGVRLLLVGDHRGHATIDRLVGNSPAIRATGRVPDVRPYLAAADVVVAPLLGVSGVRFKVMEGLAAGKPVVATENAVEGLGLVDGRDLLLAPSVAEMAPLVVRILGDGALRGELSRRAVEVAREKFDRSVEHRRLADWYRALLARRDGP